MTDLDNAVLVADLRKPWTIAENMQPLLIAAADALESARAELAQARADAQAAAAALKPFADRVFYDNGDCTVTDTHTLKAEDFIRANRTIRAIASPSGGSKLAELQANVQGWGEADRG